MKKLSGYTTTRNCVEMSYPVKESIKSAIDFCDEVIVMDSSDGKDGTKDLLADLKKEHGDKLKVYHAEIDWSVPNHGVYDGVMKQAAREKCTGEFLFQFDIDEVIHAKDRSKLDDLLSQTNYLQDVPLLCLPIVEYWGSTKQKVRLDINPWKWRVSRNAPDITHGIPLTHRKYENGLLYAQQGTDGCDYISKETGMPIPNLNFLDPKVEQVRQMALNGDGQARQQYEFWFNQMADNLPTVYHYSWFSFKKKIMNYKQFWTKFWPALYNESHKYENVFFENVKWEDVTDEMINQKAIELSQTGGHIFHKPYDGKIIPYVKINREAPELMKEWETWNSDV